MRKTAMPLLTAMAILAIGSSPLLAANGLPQCGNASWYKLTGTTASGEKANPGGMTAAHRTLPFGTEVLVTNLANGRTVKLRINDRGPFSNGRIIDVTRAAAEKLEFINSGVTRVRVSLAGQGSSTIEGAGEIACQ